MASERIDLTIREMAGAMVRDGASATAVALAMGVSRAHLYRLLRAGALGGEDGGVAAPSEQAGVKGGAPTEAEGAGGVPLTPAVRSEADANNRTSPPPPAGDLSAG
jgi:hypothetical protein